MSPPPVGRLAPSPTGALHVGHARTFLLAWLHARARGGRMLLRIEDLDAARVAPGAVDGILRDLEWIGLDWDGPPLVQSSRMGLLNAAVDQLVASGFAYPCVCSRGDIRTAQSAPHADSPEPRYPGICRGRFRTVAEAERASGKPAGLRFAVPPGAVSFVDGIEGGQAFDVQAEVGDFLVARRGGAPSYQLAVVVDDREQEVTEVVRGADLLSSTARQILLQEALSLPRPAYCHVPLVVDPAGRRFAKRERALTLGDLRERGADPRAVVAWASRVSGGPAVERTTPRELLPDFSIDRVPRTSVVVDDTTVETWLR